MKERTSSILLRWREREVERSHVSELRSFDRRLVQSFAVSASLNFCRCVRPKSKRLCVAVDIWLAGDVCAGQRFRPLSPTVSNLQVPTTN
jgi:hypothetical protein